MRRKKSDILNYSKIIVEERGAKNVDKKITKKGGAEEGQIMIRGLKNKLTMLSDEMEVIKFQSLMSDKIMIFSIL